MKKRPTKMETVKLDFEISSPQIVTNQELASTGIVLPENFTPNANQTIARFVLNHTLPSVNSRGRAVTYPTQKRSLSSVKYNPVNLEHMMTSNPLPFPVDEDIILGFMLGASIEDIEGDPDIPDRPIPTYVYGVLWNRINEVQRIIRDIETGFQSWRVSMEAIRDSMTDEILVGNEFIPVTEAPQDLLDKIGQASTGDYNGQKVALVIGGRNGFINYWGSGLVLNPADKLNPEIQLEVATQAARKKMIFRPFVIANDQNTESEEAMKKMKKALASVSETVKTVIANSGIDADKAKSITDAFNANMQEELSSHEEQIRDEFKDHVSKEDHEKAIATAKEEAVKEELPKAKQAWEKEQACFSDREAAFASAKIELTDYRKTKVREFAVSQDGDKEFASYLEDLKTAAPAPASTPATPAPASSNNDQSTENNGSGNATPETASAGTSVGNLLNVSCGDSASAIPVSKIF